LMRKMKLASTYGCWFISSSSWIDEGSNDLSWCRCCSQRGSNAHEKLRL
jgi:hypothetical protein